MQFEGKLKFLFGQKKKASSGTMVPPQMALFCIAVPLLLPPVTEMKMKSVLMRTQKKPGAASNTENTAKAFPGVCEVEQHERNGHQATCFPNVLHSTENQIKLMNTGDNGISLLKVRANEDQWVWVEANSNLLYRNGGSDYMVLPQQAQREDEQQVKKQSGMLGIKGSREARMCNETPAHLKHHLIWGKQEKEDAKVKYQPSKGNTFLQEENNLFPKHFSTVQNHCNASSGWSMKNSSGSRPGHQLIGSFSNRTSRPFYGLDQSHSGVHMVGRHLRGGAEHFQPYPGVQPHSMDSFNADNIKLESAFLSPEVLYDSGIPLNIPIKIENDSDSESRPELYSEHPGQSWIGDNTILKKQLLDFPEGLHLKTETDYNEQTLCIKPKHHMHPPHRGHCFVPATHINHINASRPFKGIYNKEAAQFCPQKCAYLESMLNLQGGDCLSNQFYAASSTDDKNQGDQSYKLQCEFKTHSLVQNIKREPLDSPPWPDSEQDAVQAIYQKNTLMGFLPSQMPRNAAEFAYIQ